MRSSNDFEGREGRRVDHRPAPAQKPRAGRRFRLDDFRRPAYKRAFRFFVAPVKQVSSMAHHQSAKKRIRQTERRTAVNRARVSRIRSFVKKVELAITGGDPVAAKAALQAAEPELMRGAKGGILHKNTASRKVSRLAARVKDMKSPA
jgi:small subunit ribosomal protein S20